MMIKSIIGTVGVCLAVASLNVTAIPVNITDNGTYTSDSATGLDWLDLSFTSGVAYSDAVSVATDVEGGGWRYATSPEVGDLFTTLFPSVQFDPAAPTSVFVGSPDPGVDQFFQLFGFSWVYNVFPLSLGYGLYKDQGGIMRMAGVSQDGLGVIIDATIYGPNSNADYTDVGLTGGREFSTYLVRGGSRNVPEPSIAILMASGLVAFGLVRIFLTTS